MDILPQLLINALITGSIYALCSSGLALTYGLLRVLNFAHGHLMMVGAYFFLYFSVQCDFSLAVAALYTALSCVAFAIVVFKIFVYPFIRLSFVLTFVTTLALSNILESIVSMTFGVSVKSLAKGAIYSSLKLGPIYITPLQILIILSAFVLLVLLALLIHSTALGRRIRALSENSQASESIGISRRRTSYFVFTVAMLLAAYSGILVGYETNLQPTMGTSYTIKAFAAMILGGMGNIWGTVAGAYLLGFVENLSIGIDFGGYSIPAGYKDAFAFLIILVMLLLRPQGLFGTKKRTA